MRKFRAISIGEKRDAARDAAAVTRSSLNPVSFQWLVLICISNNPRETRAWSYNPEQPPFEKMGGPRNFNP